MFDSPSANPNTTAWLVYNSSVSNPEPAILSAFFSFDDTELVPLDPVPVTTYDAIVTAEVNFTTINGINFAIVNNNTYVAPNVPAIFTALTTGEDATNPAIYGNTTNSFVLNHLDMIWLVINNDDSGSHPCLLFFFITPFLTFSSSSRPFLPSPVPQRGRSRAL
jgi:iron transport multicopper oxidase